VEGLTAPDTVVRCRDIAEKFSIIEHAVKCHVTHILNKRCFEPIEARAFCYSSSPGQRQLIFPCP
jgi:hypothetical protein